MNIFATLYAQMDGLIESQVLGGYDTVVGMVRGPLATGIGIYIAVAGYAVLRGLAGEGWGHLLSQGAKAGLVFAAVTTGLGGVTARSVMEWPNELAVLAGGGSPGSQIDGFVSKIDAKTSDIVHSAPKWNLMGFSIEDPTLSIISWIPKILAVLLGCLILVYVVFLKFALAVTALFGPIFVAMLLFDSTRGMFFTWLGAALGYALATVVIGITISFIFATCVASADTVMSAIVNANYGQTADAAATDAAAAGLLGVTATILVGVLFLMQAQGIAQGLAGGGGGSGAMVAGAVVPAAVGLARMAVARISPRAGASAAASAAGGGSSKGFAFQAGRTVRQATRVSQQAMRRVMGK